MRDKIFIDNIYKVYSRRNVVNGVSFNFSKGDIIGLLGPNGAGKTTTFYMVVGLVFPNKGKIFYNDIDVTEFSMYRRAKMGVGYLAQDSSVFKKLSVEDNIMAVLELKTSDKKEQLYRLEVLLSEFNIEHIRFSKGFQLSGGERRRVEIARALASEPSFLLLDEPFAGVDPIAVQEINAIILNLKKKGLGILITDHNARETLRITDRSYILTEGSISFSGSPSELASNELVRKVYLGDDFVL